MASSSSSFSKAVVTIALLLSLNLMIFTTVNATDNAPSPLPSSPEYPPSTPAPSPLPSSPEYPPSTPAPSPLPSTPESTPPSTPPSTPEYPPPTPPAAATCPMDTLKLGVCANLLNDLLHLIVGTPPQTPCCGLIDGLVDLEAAVCLCTAIKANILGINLNLPISLSLVLNYCGKGVPSGFQCA